VGVIFPANLLELLAMIPPAGLQEMSELPGMRRWRVREFGAELLQLINNYESHEPQAVESPGE
jgi:hypothetical protein